MIEPRDILIYFSIKYQGDFEASFKAIKEKEAVSEEEVINTISRIKGKCITFFDSEYPEALKEVFQPPLALFYYGDISLLEKPSRIGIVGTRTPTNYGIKATEQICDRISDSVIISGLAKGIDAIAHQKALKSSSNKTIAVLGTGLDYCYPKENLSLYLKIKEDGLIISEYPGNTLVSKKSFARRNRIIAALSEKILITEAFPKSGTLVTLRYALELGKEIYCVPHSIFSESICNELIKQGANIVVNGVELIEK